ncbi:MAG: hypothetical protein AB1627_10830 [Chloroflexota bacterium]
MTPRVGGLRRSSAAGRWRRLAVAAVAALALLPVAATVAAAHPLGNYTINHYAGIRVEPERVVLDVVIDRAEIPAFQAVRRLDADGDGTLAGPELEDARVDGCREVAAGLVLRVDGAAMDLRLTAAGVTLPPGNGGLPTMRLVCVLEAAFAAPLREGTRFDFEDAFEPTRIGWREITVVGDGVTVDAPGAAGESATHRLTAYPAGLAAASDMRSVTVLVSPGGPRLTPFGVPDAMPLERVAGASGAGGGPVGASAPAGVPGGVPAPAEVPGGVPAAVLGGEGSIPDILRRTPATPAVALLALLVAAALGAGHALTPGHGKTLMAAYLVGTRGTPRHAIGLGLAVSVSHTLGILVLAAIVVGAGAALPPDVVLRVAPLVAAVAIVAVGGWMLGIEIRRWRRATTEARVAGAADHHDDDLVRTLEDGHAHGHEGDGHGHGHGHEGDGHGHGHAQPHPHPHDHPAANAPVHEHGGIRHRHVPQPGSAVTWRGLFVLGLAGGLVPSTSALLILLAAVAVGATAWGVILVVAFGLGMAAVMAGVGLAFVYARGLVGRLPSARGHAAAARLVPLGASLVVLVVGVLLTNQALAAAALG